MINKTSLAIHAAWLNGEGGGERLVRVGSDLSGSDLSGSDLSGSDLSGSDLSGSNLRGSDLRGSDLRGSNLRGSDLRGSNLRGSDLRGSNLRDSDLRGSNLSGSNLMHARGVLHPPINDPRGYRCIAVWHSTGWQIVAGCRQFGISEAREHWGDPYTGYRTIGDAYLAALEWLEKQPEPAQIDAEHNEPTGLDAYDDRERGE